MRRGATLRTEFDIDSLKAFDGYFRFELANDYSSKNHVWYNSCTSYESVLYLPLLR